MFDLTTVPIVWIPVKWPGLIPGPESGIAVQVEHEIEVLVELVDADELKAYFFADDDKQPSDFDGFKRLVKDWRKVSSGGHPVPMTDTNIRALLGKPNFPTALQKAYLLAVAGRVETREKNSEGSPVDGRAEQATAAATTAPTNP